MFDVCTNKNPSFLFVGFLYVLGWVLIRFHFNLNKKKATKSFDHRLRNHHDHHHHHIQVRLANSVPYSFSSSLQPSSFFVFFFRLYFND